MPHAVDIFTSLILVVVILHTTFYQNLDPLKQIFFPNSAFLPKPYS